MKFLHEATYQCVCITYRPKTENWFPKSPLQIEHILEYNMLNVSPKYIPIFCIFHNSIRKSLCLIELALMHYTTKKKDMNEHLGNILHFKYQPNNFFWSAYLYFQVGSHANSRFYGTFLDASRNFLWKSFMVEQHLEVPYNKYFSKMYNT